MGGRNGGCEIVHKISEQAGLSISGVYKILNGSDSFSSEKRELVYQLAGRDRKSTRLNSSHTLASRMPSSA